MKFFDLLGIIVDNLGRRKGRVVLTAVGVIIGTASVVLLVSLAIGFQMDTNSRLGNIADLTTITVYPDYSGGGGGGGGMVVMAAPGGGGGSASQPQMKMLTTQAIKDMQGIPGVKQVIPRDYLQGQAEIHFGRLMSYGSVMGVSVNDLAVFDYPLAEGSTKLERGQAIIGGWLLKNFQDPKQRPGQETPEPPELLGQTIKLVLTRFTQDGQQENRTINLKVVGVLKEARSEADSYMFVRMEDITPWNEWFRGSRINRLKDGYDHVIVKVDNSKDVLEVSDQINAMGFMASTAQQYVQSINSFFVIMQVLFGGVGAIALLVAAIGIANTMTMAILERTREIGLMKAIGATNRDVLTIFLGEAAGIGFIGGAGGVALGWLSGQLLNAIVISYMTQQVAQTGGTPMTVAVYTPMWLPLFALFFATLVGLISGLYPSLRAATLVPVTALKYE
jgi:putative ABC transport system permease protein